MIKIIEVEYSCSPGGIDEFEVYLNGDYIRGYLHLDQAIARAYELANEHGLDIHIHTLAHYHATYDFDDPDVTNELLQAVKRGVNIRMVTETDNLKDKENFINKNSGIINTLGSSDMTSNSIVINSFD